MFKPPFFIVNTWYIVILLGFIFHNYGRAQQSIDNYDTYTLQIQSIQTSLKNNLNEVQLNINFNPFTRVESDGDLEITVTFLEGIQYKYLLQTALPDVGFTYKTIFTLPTYRLTVIDKYGNLLLREEYGGEKSKAYYGEYENFTSVDELEKSWPLNRNIFFKQLENEQLDIPTLEFYEELKQVRSSEKKTSKSVVKKKASKKKKRAIHKRSASKAISNS